MHVFNDLSQLVSVKPAVLTMGMFDGVHLGHQALINAVVQSARSSGYTSTLVTFFPHPSVVLRHAPACYLTTNVEKIAELERLGLDQVIMLEFTLATAQLRAAEFTRILVERLNMREMWIGYDFAMGYKREGNSAFLERFGAELGFSTHTITEPVMVYGQPVSSSRIRPALKGGDMQTVNACMGRRFRLSGSALKNARFDAYHGILTAELPVCAEQAIPGSGVYACQARIDQDSRWLPAVLDLKQPCAFDCAITYFKIYIEAESEPAFDHPVTVELLKNLRNEVSLTYTPLQVSGYPTQFGV